MALADRSDARTGSGIGFAPVGSDGRDVGERAESRALGERSPMGVSPAVASFSAGAQETDSNVARNEDGNPNSGAQQGSPRFMYPLDTHTGMEPIELAPIDGGMVDPIRRGDTPARRPFSRFLFITSKWWRDIEGDFSHKDRVIAGEANNGPKASQPHGRHMSMDEYRLLGDGSHA